ncbi:hypothetical protein [Bradyrhizobium sp. CCBAU 051011]|uniref:hypothetical protein n=1 Tax=Bradyrhizobium sp. CCBAU 051011 TaxID=858422 RepID=UPI00137A391F|nr:hypothetical protein [Bradyrhizobium sp. CCBAU 051011]
MKRLLVASILTVLAPTTVALAGNTSSNSSSNSSNGVHTRVDTITTDDGRRRTIYERRSVRIDADRGRPYMRSIVRERTAIARCAAGTMTTIKADLRLLSDPHASPRSTTYPAIGADADAKVS